MRRRKTDSGKMQFLARDDNFLAEADPIDQKSNLLDSPSTRVDLRDLRASLFLTKVIYNECNVK